MPGSDLRAKADISPMSAAVCLRFYTKQGVYPKSLAQLLRWIVDDFAASVQDTEDAEHITQEEAMRIVAYLREKKSTFEKHLQKINIKQRSDPSTIENVLNILEGLKGKGE